MEVRVESARLAELERRVAIAETVGRIAASITSRLDLRAVIQEAVGSCRELLGAEAASVALYDEVEHELVFDVIEGGAGDRLKTLRIKMGEGVLGWVGRERSSIAVADVAADPRFCARFDDSTGFVTRTVVAAPLVVRGRLLGVIEAINRETPFGPEDAETLEALCPHVAAALENAQITARLVGRKDDLEREVLRRVAQIEAAKKEWERTFDAIEDRVLLIQRDFRVRRANLITAAHAGLTIDELPGRRCYEVAFGRDGPCEGCPLPRTLAGLAGAATVQHGSEVYHASHFPLEDSQGQVYAAVCTYRDVTDARRMEVRLRETERLASVGQLAAGVAHEINNPLAFLSSNLGTLRSYVEDLGALACTAGGAQPLQNEILEILDESEQGARRVAHIVAQLKTFAWEHRSTDGPVRLADSVERAACAVRAERPEAKVEIEDPDAARIVGDPLAVDQALAALLRNAAQAAPGRPVQVRIRHSGELVILTVEDEGPGIPADIRPRIFDPFFTTRGIGGGLGLGLSSAYATVRRHHGTIEALDRPGGGARILVKLPAAPPGV